MGGEAQAAYGLSAGSGAGPIMKRISLALIALTLTGCAVGPNYKRPQVALPAAHRGAAEQANPSVSLADTKWDSLFQDETLNGLIRTALERNFDVRIAAERIEQARAQLDRKSGGEG